GKSVPQIASRTSSAGSGRREKLLDRDRPSHGSRDRKEAVQSPASGKAPRVMIMMLQSIPDLRHSTDKDSAWIIHSTSGLFSTLRMPIQCVTGNWMTRDNRHSGRSKPAAG